ncbi:MAG: VWA domain-containing protein [Gammaproteobacteria bacterium PRO9]|nr:VWA domain-containing protein [Gammaproteobacteria bacterium PRO9]
MLIRFFFTLREFRVPVSIREFLTLLDALRQQVIGPDIDEFYQLARTALVKDECHFDRYDQAFAAFYKGVESAVGAGPDIPLEWLRKQAELELSAQEKALVESLGGWEALMEQFRQRLAEQKGRHQGGNKWIGTGGTSPFGAYGYNPEGIRIGQDRSRNRSAVKVWDRREFRNLDGDVQLGTRNLKVALRRLRRFAREGAADELDLDSTIDHTARNAGWLDLKLRPERHNAVKVLLLLDIGGSMDDYTRLCSELFSAARSEFRHLESWYFHNCVYDFVWQDSVRRHTERTPTWDLLHRFNHDYRLIFVGDAAMSPYELLRAGGSIEYMNAEPGIDWLQRLTGVYQRSVWLNPTPEAHWPHHASTRIIHEAMEGRMYPLTLSGLDTAMRALMRAA